MPRRPGIVWIFLRVLLTAIGVFVAAAVVGWVARLISGRNRPRNVHGREVGTVEPVEEPEVFRLSEDDVVDVSYSEVEEVHK